jgi:hypothetical protein
MARTPRQTLKLREVNSATGAVFSLEIKAKKRLDALVTNYLLQGMPEDEARDLALKDVLRRPRPRCSLASG